MLQASPRTSFETRTLTVGFSLDLPPGVTLSNPVVTAEPGPSQSSVKDNQAGATETLSGPPVVNTQPVTISYPGYSAIQSPGQAISQQVQAGLPGAWYVYRFKASRSDGDTCEADVLQPVLVYVP